jgi:hypothetical protein
MKKKLASNSLEMRNLTRHKMPPPTFYIKDKKKAANKAACR